MLLQHWHLRMEIHIGFLFPFSCPKHLISHSAFKILKTDYQRMAAFLDVHGLTQALATIRLLLTIGKTLFS